MATGCVSVLLIEDPVEFTAVDGVPVGRSMT